MTIEPIFPKVSIDIRKKVPASDEGRFCKGDRKTIAQYYKDLAKIKDDSKVVYAYVSPLQLGDPSEYDFCQELRDRVHLLLRNIYSMDFIVVREPSLTWLWNRYNCLYL